MCLPCLLFIYRVDAVARVLYTVKRMNTLNDSMDTPTPSQARTIRTLAAGLQRIPFLLNLMRGLWRYTRPRYTAGAVGVIFNTQGEVLLVKHVFHAYTPWGLPGGYMNNREDPDRALARELREELALDARIGPVVTVQRAFGGHLDIAYWCRADDLTIGKLSPELVDFAWVNIDALPELRDFHRDAIHRAALLWRMEQNRASSMGIDFVNELWI